MPEKLTVSTAIHSLQRTFVFVKVEREFVESAIGEEISKRNRVMDELHTILPIGNIVKFVRDACPHYLSGNVPEGHVCDAKVVLIGEAAGKTEHQRGIPFCGPSGFTLESELLPRAGLKREDLYIANVIPYRPAGNKLENVPKEHFASGIASIRRRVPLRNPNAQVIVAAGNLALSASTSKNGIMKWRGSVLAPVWQRFDGNSEHDTCRTCGRERKSCECNTFNEALVYPVIHPASAFREPLIKKTMVKDWERIGKLVRGEYKAPKRELICCSPEDPRLKELLNADTLAIDIESDIETSKVLCVGFAANPWTAYSVDCRYGIPPIVHQLCNSKSEKVLQNGLFDLFVLQLAGVKVENFKWDTSCMFHALDNIAGPTGSEGKSFIKPYSLAYMASIFTWEPYWKDSAKDDLTGEAYGKWKSNFQLFCEYNARDAAVTFEIYERLESLLKASGRLTFYKEQYPTLFYPLLKLMRHGVKFDLEAAKLEATKIQSQLSELKRTIAAEAGTPLNAFKVYKREPKKKDQEGLLTPDAALVAGYEQKWVLEGSSVSNAKLKEYVRTKYGSKVLPHKGAKETLDAVGILKVLKKYPQDKVLRKVLEFRKLEKTKQFVESTHADKDGRIRCFYSQLVMTGRLSSSANPTGTGMNLQNIQRNVRHLFKPDFDGWVFVSADLVQAEDLVVKALSKNPRALEAIKQVQSGKGDAHKKLAAQVFNIPEDQVTKEKRQAAKTCRHLRNYDGQAERMCDTLLKMGFEFTVEEVQRIINAAAVSDPWVEEWQNLVRSAVMQRGKLVTGWGWQYDTAYMRFRDTRDYKEAYAFQPQNEVGRLALLYGFANIMEYIEAKALQSRVNLLVHDDVTVSCPIEEAWEIAAALVWNLERSRRYKIRTTLDESLDESVVLSIPAEVTITPHWKCACDACKKENKVLSYRELPPKDELEKQIKEMLAK